MQCFTAALDVYDIMTYGNGSWLDVTAHSFNVSSYSPTLNPKGGDNWKVFATQINRIVRVVLCAHFL